MGGSDEGEGKQVLVGICAMAKKSQSKPMKEILTRLEEFEYIKIIVFPEEVILKVIYSHYEAILYFYVTKFVSSARLLVYRNL